MRRAIHLAALAVLAYTYYFIHTWMPRLPDRVPTHFGWQGKPDAWGSPNSVWIPFYMQIGVTCLLLLLPALCARYPQIGHIGTRRLSDLAAASREEAMALIGEMTSRMLLAFNLLFFYITRETVKAAMMPGAIFTGWPILAFVVVIGLIAIVYVFRLQKIEPGEAVKTLDT